MDYKQILLTYANYFEQSDVASNVIRWIGWKLIMLLHGICDVCQSLWEAVFQVLGFTQVIGQKLGQYYPIWYAVFLVTILAVGTMFLYSERRPPFLRNLMITIAVVMLLPGGVQVSVRLLGIEQTAFMADGNSVADTTVISHVTDLLYQKNNGWSFSSPNCLSGTTIRYIDPNEQVEKKTDKVFKYYMVVNETNGSVEYKEIKKGFFGLLTPLYYRYSIQFMSIIGELVVNILVLVFASYRLFRLIWDMVYGEILAYILSGDVVSGEKTKQVLQYLLNLFWSISIMIWGFAIWREFEIWVSNEYSNNFVRILLIAFGGIAMIDGPDIVERIFGIDVGMKDGLMKTMGAIHLMQSGIGLAKSGRGLAKSATSAAHKVGSSMLNPGGKGEQTRIKGNAQEPPGGAGTPQGSASVFENQRQEPPGSVKQQNAEKSSPRGEVSSQSSAAEMPHTESAGTGGGQPEPDLYRSVGQNEQKAGDTAVQTSAQNSGHPARGSSAADSESAGTPQQMPGGIGAADRSSSVNRAGIANAGNRQDGAEGERAQEKRTKEGSQQKQEAAGRHGRATQNTQQPVDVRKEPLEQAASESTKDQSPQTGDGSEKTRNDQSQNRPQQKEPPASYQNASKADFKPKTEGFMPEEKKQAQTASELLQGSKEPNGSAESSDPSENSRNGHTGIAVGYMQEKSLQNDFAGIGAGNQGMPQQQEPPASLQNAPKAGLKPKAEEFMPEEQKQAQTASGLQQGRKEPNRSAASSSTSGRVRNGHTGTYTQEESLQNGFAGIGVENQGIPQQQEPPNKPDEKL